jgi:hypothetical protein
VTAVELLLACTAYSIKAAHGNYTSAATACAQNIQAAAARNFLVHQKSPKYMLLYLLHLLYLYRRAPLLAISQP